jgi:hypothetical protein
MKCRTPTHTVSEETTLARAGCKGGDNEGFPISPSFEVSENVATEMKSLHAPIKPGLIMSDRHSGAGIQTRPIEESSRTFDPFFQLRHNQS